MVSVKEKVKSLKELGAVMLPGMFIPTHKRFGSGELFQVITVATLRRSNEINDLKRIYVVYRDEKYNVWTMQQPDFATLHSQVEHEHG